MCLTFLARQIPLQSRTRRSRRIRRRRIRDGRRGARDGAREDGESEHALEEGECGAGFYCWCVSFFPSFFPAHLWFAVMCSICCTLTSIVAHRTFHRRSLPLRCLTSLTSMLTHYRNPRLRLLLRKPPPPRTERQSSVHRRDRAAPAGGRAGPAQAAGVCGVFRCSRLNIDICCFDIRYCIYIWSTGIYIWVWVHRGLCQ